MLLSDPRSIKAIGRAIGGQARTVCGICREGVVRWPAFLALKNLQHSLTGTMAILKIVDDLLRRQKPTRLPAGSDFVLTCSLNGDGVKVETVLAAYFGALRAVRHVTWSNGALIPLKVAEWTGVLGADTYNRLEEIGRDCVGALQFLP